MQDTIIQSSLLHNFIRQMKHLPIFLISLILLCFFGCGNKLQSAESDPLAQYRDTLIGNFNGLEIDTLIAEPIDTTIKRGLWHWRIKSASGNIASMTIRGRFDVRFTAEGDLDGNGTDDFGIRSEKESGTWDSYMVYTYQDNEWEYLIQPIWTYSTHFYETLNKGADVVQPTSQKELVKVRFSDIRNDDFCIIDTLIKVAPYSISNQE